MSYCLHVSEDLSWWPSLTLMRDDTVLGARSTSEDPTGSMRSMRRACRMPPRSLSRTRIKPQPRLRAVGNVLPSRSRVLPTPFHAGRWQKSSAFTPRHSVEISLGLPGSASRFACGKSSQCLPAECPRNAGNFCVAFDGLLIDHLCQYC